MSHVNYNKFIRV